MEDSPHKSQYKYSGKTLASSIEERTQTQIRLRKENRAEELNKKRFNAETAAAIAGAESPMPIQLLEEVRVRQDYDVASLIPMIMNDLDRDTQLNAIHKCRSLLSRERNPPIDVVIKAGVVPKAIELLAVETRPDLQFQSAWLLTNILSGTTEQTLYVVNSGVVPALLNLLSSPSPDVREQSIWALANIAGESADLRDALICVGLAPIVIRAITAEQRQTLIRQAVWLLSNLCRPHGRPTDPSVLLGFVPLLVPLIQSSVKTDPLLCTDALWAVTYIADRSPGKIDALLSAGMAPVLVTTLQTAQDADLLVACTKAVLNMQTPSAVHAQPFLDAGILYVLKEVFGKKPRVVQLALSLVSHFCSLSHDNVSRVLRSVLVPVLSLCRGSMDVAIEATTVLSTIIIRGTPEQALNVVAAGALPLIVERLVDSTKSANPTLLLKALARLLAIGKNGSERNEVAVGIEEHRGIEILEALEMNPHQGVSGCANTILQNYFHKEPEAEASLPALNGGAWGYQSPGDDMAPFEF